MKSPIVSVVIPAFNEATYIDRLLEALSDQTLENFEVIISDAESKDGTKEVVDSFKNKLDVKFFEAPPKGPAFGRNQGAKHTRGEWLLFLDADVYIDNQNFIEELLSKTIAKGWNTSSAQLKVMPGSLLGKIGHSQAYLNIMSHTKHPIMQGYCMLTRREIFEKLDGFNEKIRYGEDNDYATRAAGYGLGFVKGTYYWVDPRRYQQEGFRLLYKNTQHELYRLTHGFSFEENTTEYEFGKHKKRAKD
jgi:glycosyltransferase involved in cell wall biosynthesis